MHQFNYRSWWNQFKLELLTSIFRGNFAVYLPFVQTTKHLTAALLFQITTQQNRLLKGLQMGKQMTFCAKSLALRLGYLSEIPEHILHPLRCGLTLVLFNLPISSIMEIPKDWWSSLFNCYKWPVCTLNLVQKRLKSNIGPKMAHIRKCDEVTILRSNISYLGNI